MPVVFRLLWVVLFAALLAAAPFFSVEAARGTLVSPLGFGFTLPRGWEGYGVGGSGAYFTVVTRDDKAEIAVALTWGMPQGDRTEPYEFIDGGHGAKVFVGAKDLFYTRRIATRQVTVSIHAPRAWLKKNARKVEALGRSLRPMRMKPFKLPGKTARR